MHFQKQNEQLKRVVQQAQQAFQQQKQEFIKQFDLLTKENREHKFSQDKSVSKKICIKKFSR